MRYLKTYQKCKNNLGELMRVGYIGGSWSTNIGNSFYNMGALWLLKNVYGNDNVSFIPDPPQVYWGSLDHDYGLAKVSPNRWTENR